MTVLLERDLEAEKVDIGLDLSNSSGVTTVAAIYAGGSAARDGQLQPGDVSAARIELSRAMGAASFQLILRCEWQVLRKVVSCHLASHSTLHTSDRLITRSRDR